MKKLLTLGIVAGALVALGLSLTATSALADPGVETSVRADEDACKRTEYKTEMVKKACAEGGQAAAARAMKQFVKRIKKELGEPDVSCKTCHTDMAPDYPNAPDALEQFEAYQKKLKAKSAQVTPAQQKAMTAFVRGH